MTSNYKSIFSIEIDYKLKIIKVGDWSTKDIYFNFVCREKNIDLRKEILSANNIKLTSYYRKKYGLRDTYKELHKYFGSKFNYRLFSAMWKLHIEPISDYCNNYCFYSNGNNNYYDIAAVKRIWKHKKNIDTATRDRLYNIIPLLIYFGLNPRQLKNKMGSGLWKRLCKNSTYKNKMIVAVLQKILKDKKRIGSFRFNDYKINIISRVSGIKSTLIKYAAIYDTFYNIDHSDCSLFSLEWLSINARVSYYQEVIQLYHLAFDTFKMAKAVGKNTNTRWSTSRLKQEHDRMLKLEIVDEFPTLPNFDHISDGCFCDIEFKLLRTSLEIFEEGQAMKHCVAFYIENVVYYGYLVFSLKKGEMRSTLGLSRINNKFVIHQHCGYENSKIEDNNFIEASYKIASIINMS